MISRSFAVPPNSAAEAKIARDAIGFTPSRQTAPAAPAPKPTPAPATRNAAVAELHATLKGKELGRRYLYDATRMADSIGASVTYPDVDELDGDRYRAVTGRTWLPTRTITIAGRLPAYERERVLAHELGHLVLDLEGLDDVDVERACDAFATSFLTRPPTEQQLNRDAWDRLQRQAYQKWRLRR